SDYGRLQELLVDPGQERVVGLLVRPHGWLPYHPVVVPENAIAEASENEVRLNISREQVDALPEYLPDSEFVVNGRNYEVEDELLLIRSGQRVLCQDEPAGWVALLLLEPGGRVKGFVLHTNPLIGRNLIVPITWVREVDGNRLYLSVEKKDLQGLHDYRLDDALTAEAKNALWSDEILRNTDYKEIGVSAEDGIVKLRGHVISAFNKTRAEKAAGSVVGVLGLENGLVVDDDLVTGVAQALAKDDRTRFEQISVGVQNGFITLNGHVHSGDLRKAAEAIAASAPQVRGVINYLQAPNVAIDPKEGQVWQPPFGQEVSAADMQLGHVERVIINPRNRRVTAFVTRGTFPDPQAKDDYRLPGEDAQQERSVVIPIDAVRYATDSSVLLKVRGAEAALYRSFEPADFVSPPVGWQPPYPYRWEQVLFDRERSEGL
ncbi:MAG TPA: BON domain-containing protein, partial [Nitrospiraceae bacterium]|nr:BON domain-containing protein [Nitrospiraceae bacterium]